MVWKIVLFLVWTSSSDGLKVNRINEGLDTVPRNIDRSVKELKLDNNNLVTLDSSSFDIYVHLRRLSLKECKTTYILDGTFDNHHDLGFIWLSKCNILQLPSSFGPSTTTLQEFDIYGGANPDVFRNPYFTAFTNLKRLVLGGRGSMEPIDISIVPVNMEKLRLDRTKLYTFPNFRLHTKLSILSVADNYILTIPQEYIATLLVVTQFRAFKNILQGFPSLSHMKQLRLLEIYNNRISSIPREHIDGLESLQKFLASDNLVEIMPNISDLPKLEIADFSNNLIRYVPASCLYGLPMIQSLYLNGNRITLMDDNSWRTGNLYLHDNMFTTPPDLYDMTSASLTLRGNPLLCDQSLCWLRMWPFNKDLPTLDAFSCSSPAALNGLLVMETHPTDLGCYTGKHTTHNYMDIYIQYIHIP